MQVAETVPLLEEAWKREFERDPSSNKALVRALGHVFKWRMIGRFLAKLMF